MLSRRVVQSLFAGMLIALLLVATSSAQRQEEQVGANTLRETELERLRALVEADMSVAEMLHADDFQLINPAGATFTKAEYLGGIASGAIDYLVWEPIGDIAVRFHGDSAVVRYRARLEISVSGQRLPEGRFWHTDAYEVIDGRWQVVWSQATEIR